MIEITTPASTRDLTTAEYVLRKWTGDDPDSELLADAISAASGFCAKWCRREFVLQEYEESIEAPERLKVVLSESPVTAVDTVVSDGDAITNYKIYEKLGILEKTDSFPWTGPIRMGGPLGASMLVYDRESSLVINYTAGYITRAMVGTRNLPDDLEDAVAYLAREILKSDLGITAGEAIETKVGNFHTINMPDDSMQASGAGYWAETVGDVTMTWIPMRVRRVFLLYRRFMI